MFRYASAQLAVPDPLARDLAMWADHHVPAADALGRIDDPHVTVLNGLRTTNKLQAHGITVTLGKIDIFDDDPRFDVVVVRAHGVGLFALHHALKSLPHVTAKHAYKPHVTLAYVRKGACQDLAADPTFDGRLWYANALTFSAPDGSDTPVPLHRP